MDAGGAERQLVTLSRELRQRGHEVSVLLYYTGGEFDAELVANGIRIIDLKKRGRWHNFRFLMRLAHAVRSERPDVLHSYLPFSNLLAVLLRCVADETAVVCGVRASGADTNKHDFLMRWMLRVERRIVVAADLVVVNSFAGERYLSNGRRYDNVVTIDNGIDTRRFFFDEDGRRQMRQMWGVADGVPVIGCVARLDPLKDHGTLLRAFADLGRSRPEVRLVCLGTGPEAYAVHLKELARTLGVWERISWLLPTHRVREAYSAFDVFCLSSVSEGFPNALAEAAACGVPCVATDVGDVKRILSSNDFVVPVGNPRALAESLASGLSQGRVFSVSRAERIRADFSVARLAERTELALAAAVQKKRARVLRNTPPSSSRKRLP